MLLCMARGIISQKALSMAKNWHLVKDRYTLQQFSFVWLHVSIHLPLNHIPEVFIMVQVQRLGLPWQGLDLLVLPPLLAVWHETLSCWKKTVQSSELGSRKQHIFFQDNRVCGFDSCVVPAQLQPYWSIPRNVRGFNGCTSRVPVSGYWD